MSWDNFVLVCFLGLYLSTIEKSVRGAVDIFSEKHNLVNLLVTEILSFRHKKDGETSCYFYLERNKDGEICKRIRFMLD